MVSLWLIAGLAVGPMPSCDAVTARTAHVSAEDAGELRAELIRRGEADQRIRQMDLDILPEDRRQALLDEGARVDLENQAWLEAHVEQRGWPRSSVVGDEASQAAFLIVQHADHRPEWQAVMLPLMMQAARCGEASRRLAAYLYDRVQNNAGRPQLYGTQYRFRKDAQGEMILNEQGRPTYLPPLVENIRELDARRAEMQMEPWRDYEVRMAEIQGRPLFDAPEQAPAVPTS